MEAAGLKQIAGNIAKDEPATFEDMTSRVALEILTFYTTCYQWSIDTQIQETQRLIDHLQTVVDDAKKENKDDENKKGNKDRDGS